MKPSQLVPPELQMLPKEEPSSEIPPGGLFLIPLGFWWRDEASGFSGLFKVA
jgi:hypothetical protein